jgi:NAD(P)H dehydrogenase (quinone)
MARVLVVFHSGSGVTWRMAEAVAEGVDSVSGCDAVLQKVTEIEAAPAIYGTDMTQKRAPFAHVPEADPAALDQYDGFAFGTPVHFGSMSAAIRTFLDQTGQAWMAGSLIGRPATVFTGAGSGAGRETAILSMWSILGVHGMVIVPPGLRAREVLDQSSANGGSPLGAGTITAGEGNRPSAAELAVARAQGLSLAEVTMRLTS